MRHLTRQTTISQVLSDISSPGFVSLFDTLLTHGITCTWRI